MVIEYFLDADFIIKIHSLGSQYCEWLNSIRGRLCTTDVVNSECNNYGITVPNGAEILESGDAVRWYGATYPTCDPGEQSIFCTARDRPHGGRVLCSDDRQALRIAAGIGMGTCNVASFLRWAVECGSLDANTAIIDCNRVNDVGQTHIADTDVVWLESGRGYDKCRISTIGPPTFRSLF